MSASIQSDFHTKQDRSQVSEPTGQLLADGRSDWSKIDFDPECPRCGYNLRMLESSRCPECGLEIDWPNFLDVRLRNSSLFEHQWRNQPIRSWANTATRSLHPWRFWKEMSLYDQVQVKPLLFYLALSPLLFVFSFHVVSWGVYEFLQRLDVLLAKNNLPHLPGPIAEIYVILEQVTLPRVLWPYYPILTYVAAFIAMIGGSTLMLVSLRQTLGRCRVRPAQVLRVAAYSSYLIAIIVPYWFIAVTFLPLYILGGDFAAAVYSTRLILIWQLVQAIATCLLPAYMLAIGLRRYLGLPNAFLLGLVSSFVGLLAGGTAIFFLQLR